MNKPDAIHRVPAPRFAAKAALDGVIKQTGDIPDGVELVTPDLRISARISTAQEDVIRELVATGGISLTEIESAE